MHDQALALSELLGTIKESIAQLYNQGYWVCAEVLKVSGHAHKYLELVEYDDNRREVAKTTGMIWKSDISMLDRFKDKTSLSLAPGMKILFKAKPVFHEVHGMSLVLMDIDPLYTLGDMQARLVEIRNFLKEKQWWNLNRSKLAPSDFTRIAVISPSQAAGLGDFQVYANKLDELGLCQFHYYHAVFQGKDVADQIVDRMIQVHEQHKTTPFDALVLIRGGGDKAGLYQLNNVRLAVATCRFPLPILVGIGHEQDKTILDEVACQSYSTPSLLISHIQNTIIKNATDAQSFMDTLERYAQAILERAASDGDRMISSLQVSSGKMLENAYQDVSIMRNDLLHLSDRKLALAEVLATQYRGVLEGNATRCYDVLRDLLSALMDGAVALLDRAQHDIEKKVGLVMTSNPLSILGKGYCYLQHKKNIIGRADQVKKGDQLDIHMKNGIIKANVKDVINGQQ